MIKDMHIDITLHVLGSDVVLIENGFNLPSGCLNI